ncbi:MAG TPA: hypothetical protein VGG71_16360, partial [Chitinophagaceae bacterium]
MEPNTAASSLRPGSVSKPKGGIICPDVHCGSSAFKARLITKYNPTAPMPSTTYGTKLILMLGGMMFVVIMGCHKLCPPRQFSFTGDVANVLPDKDSIRIGDTIWFSSSIPVNYKYWGGSDSVSYNLSGAKNVATDIHLTTLVVPHEPIGAIDSFLFVVKRGAMKLNPLAPHVAQTI